MSMKQAIVSQFNSESMHSPPSKRINERSKDGFRSTEGKPRDLSANSSTKPHIDKTLIKYRHLLEALIMGHSEKVDVQKLYDMCK
jgi:hypothetical protein